jgi:hypothetical protein
MMKNNRKIEHLHTAVITLECAERKSSVMKPNEQAKEDDSQPVNIMAPHVCPLRLFDYVLFIKD